jgi:hypothetical protein
LSIKLKLVNENRLGIVAVELHPEQQCIWLNICGRSLYGYIYD